MLLKFITIGFIWTQYNFNVEEIKNEYACNILSKINMIFQSLSDNVEISRNGYENEIGTKRSSDSIEDAIETFIKSNDVKFKLPYVGDLKVDSRKLDDNEINFKLNFGSEVEGESCLI